MRFQNEIRGLFKFCIIPIHSNKFLTFKSKNIKKSNDLKQLDIQLDRHKIIAADNKLLWIEIELRFDNGDE